jgi:hypothetical protein
VCLVVEIAELFSSTNETSFRKYKHIFIHVSEVYLTMSLLAQTVQHQMLKNNELKRPFEEEPVS